MRGKLLLALGAVCLAMAPATAVAEPWHGDAAILPGEGFVLNPCTLEPGAFAADSHEQWFGHGQSVVIDEHIDVTQVDKSIHVTVKPDANFSVDQVLVPGRHGGYRVVNTFDTGTVADDPDIDPGQTAVDLLPPTKDDPPIDTLDRHLKSLVIVAVSDHPDADQNEPYEQANDWEVAAINRPILTPFVSALGVSAIEPLNTYKIGFGYKVDQWYDPTWLVAFNTDRDLRFWHGDPQAFDVNHDMKFELVYVKTRPEQPGVRRYNDITEAGEAWSGGFFEKADYGQPVIFKSTGDPTAYLHKDFASLMEGSWAIDEVKHEAMVDETSVAGLLSFTAQGDLPVSWAIKSSLAPERYGRKATLTDDDLRAWEAAWQAYYKGTGPKPTLPLAPGTNSPAPDPGIVINLPQTAVTVTTPAGTQVTQQQSQKAVEVSTRVVKIKIKKGFIRARVTYMSAKGLKTVLAKKSHGRMYAKVDLRGLPVSSKVWAIQVAGRKANHKLVMYTILVKL